MSGVLPDYRKAERTAFCRLCESEIPRGSFMISWYTSLNRGQNIHMHPECVIDLGSFAVSMKEKNQ